MERSAEHSGKGQSRRSSGARLSVQTIGRLSFCVGGREAGPVVRKSRALLGYLAMSETGEESRDRLVGLLWSEGEDKKARASLRQSLYEIRAAFDAAGFDGLSADRNRVTLDRSRIDVDLWTIFDEAAAGVPHAILLQYERPMDRLLDEFDAIDPAFRDWLLARRQFLGDRLTRLLETASRDSNKSLADREALARALLNLDSTHEEAVRLLIRARNEAGDVGGALRVYKTLWDHLDADYDVEPTTETQELIAGIKLGQPAAVARMDAPATIVVARGEDRESSIEHLEPLLREFIGPLGARLTPDAHNSFVLDFADPRAAVQAMFLLSSRATPHSAPVVRLGGHVVENVDSGRRVAKDVAATLAAAAEPGQVLVSSQLRDVLTDNLDAVIEDRGLAGRTSKSVELRAYGLAPPVDQKATLAFLAGPVRPSIAVIPFECRSSDEKHSLIGCLLAEELLTKLSTTKEFDVISRLSSRSFRGRFASLDEIHTQLGAIYVLSGTYDVRGNVLDIQVEFTNTRSGSVLWRRAYKERLITSLGAMDLAEDLLASIAASILTHELQLVQSRPLETVENYSLLMAAISLSHRTSRVGFNQARAILELLVERVPMHPLPMAWLAKWYIFKINQGWSESTAADGELAFGYAARASDADPSCSTALMVDAWANLSVRRRFDTAAAKFEQALEVNPNDSTAWLLRAMMYCFVGDDTKAVQSADRAIRLSPLDPRRSYYDSLAASAYGSAGQYDKAIELAQRSLRLDRSHGSTLRTLAISQYRSGRIDEARKTVREVLALDPTLTVTKYLSIHPAAEFATGKLWAKILGEAGLPP
jgi:adenylate cyclase